MKMKMKTCEKIGCQIEFKKKKNQIQTSLKFQFEKLKKVRK